MHVLYVRETTDELIYSKEDWSDLTGAEANKYWIWGPGATEPDDVAGPPRQPKLLELDEWSRIGAEITDPPSQWLGVVPDADYTVDVNGNVSTFAGRRVLNPQGVGEMVERACGQRGGRFKITRRLRIVLVGRRSDEGFRFVAAGLLDEPFRLKVDEDDTPAPMSLTNGLRAGDPYVGPTDSRRGAFVIRSARGGGIGRKRAGGVNLAIDDPDTSPELAANVRRVLEAWRELGGPGRPFFVNGSDHAWLEQNGQALFLANVPGGFVFRQGPANGSENTNG